MDEGEGRVYLGSRQAEDGRAWPVAAADVGRPRRGERSEGSRGRGRDARAVACGELLRCSCRCLFCWGFCFGRSVAAAIGAELLQRFTARSTRLPHVRAEREGVW